ncbi:hypothetical protein TYRP_011862 [Tyrophagus putrescentiae]|nr:hypothetical protein TYRP_011862 [Tyrophagus putrescentiae]
MSYQNHAWGHDLLLPVTESFENQNAFDLPSSSNQKKSGSSSSLPGNGETLLQALPTLYIMGLKEQFTAARDWLAGHHINSSWLTDLGPLLSAHALSGEALFLERAVEIANYWLPRYRQLDRLTGNNVQLLWSAPELMYLAQVTGEEERYFSAVEADYERYKSYEKEEHDFEGFRRMLVELIYFLQDDVPDSSNLLHFRKALTKMTSKGGSFGGDYSGVPRLRTGSRPPHRAYIATDITKHMALEDCTYGGIFALASTIFTANRYQSKPEPLTLLGLGRALVDTCHRAASARRPAFRRRRYALTPYLAQTYYLLHRVTGDEAYRRMAWELVVAIEKFCKVVGTEEQSGGGEPPEHLDVMPPAFLGATLKYLYLIFADDDAGAGDEKKNFRFPVDQWVFTLSGHPIPAHAKLGKKQQCLF